MKPRKEMPIEVNLGSATVFKLGTKRFDLSDPFHLAVTLSYGGFVALIGVWFVVINTIFATLYTLAPGCITNVHTLRDAFFFSVETMATVGYGAMVPASTYGHVVASLESVMGVAYTAVATGIIFVRFSRPRSRMLFAKTAVVTRHDGVRTLMVRLAYARSTTLMNVNVQLDVMMVHQTKEGTTYRVAQPLQLVRSRMPALVLAWTVMHVIDEQSPLWGVDDKKLVEDDGRVLLTVSGRDQQLGVEIHDLKNWTASEITWNAAYRDVVTYNDKHQAHADLRLISDVLPLPHSPSDDDGSEKTS